MGIIHGNPRAVSSARVFTLFKLTAKLRHASNLAEHKFSKRVGGRGRR